MTSQSSADLIDLLENQVENHVHDAVKTFQNLSVETLMKPSVQGGWSIAQCLWHLNSYGDYYLPKIAAGLAKNYPVSREFRSTWFGDYFTRIMKPGAQMKKFKAFKNHVPPSDIDADKVVATFIQQQELLLKYLTQARHTDMDRVRIPISILKWVKLKLGDVFQFIIAHNERHLQQAKRNLPGDLRWR